MKKKESESNKPPRLKVWAWLLFLRHREVFLRKWENEIAQLHSFFLSLSLSLSLSVSLSLLTPEKVASIMDVVFVGRRSVTRLRSQPEIYCTASTSLWRETAWSSFRASSCWMEATDAAGVTGLSSILSHISYLLYLITCECVCVCVRERPREITFLYLLMCICICSDFLPCM